MATVFPKIRVGQGIRHEALSVFPLLTDTDSSLEYLLSLEVLNRAPWKQVDPVGEGEEHRAKLDADHHGSALSFEGRLVHGSVLRRGGATDRPSVGGLTEHQRTMDEQAVESERTVRQLFARIERDGWDCTHCGRHGVAHKDFRLSIGPQSCVICRKCGWVQESPQEPRETAAPRASPR